MIALPRCPGLFCGSRARDRNPQERRPQEYVWLLVLDSNWLVDRVQPVSNPGLRVTHSWGTSFLLVSCRFVLRARAQKSHPTVTGIIDTNFLPNATGNGDRKLVSVIPVTVGWLARAHHQKEHLELNYLFMKPPVVEALLQITYVKEGFHYWWFNHE